MGFVDRKGCDKSQFWGGGVIVLSIYDGQEHRTVQPTHVHVVHVLDPCTEVETCNARILLHSSREASLRT